MSKFALLPLQLLVSALFLASTDAFLPFSFQDESCPADKDQKWSYRGKNGPRNWGKKYEQCNGEKQSPIDISSQDAVKDEKLAQLAFNSYDNPLTEAIVENNGHAIEVKPRDDVERTISVEGETYTLHQFHFHWGRKYEKGSEHALDGKRYDMEMHLVHMNGDKIAVVGIFFEEQGEENEALQPIVEQLSKLKYRGSETDMTTPLNLNSLLPANPTSFFRYDGSLTTPGCAEGVTWSVLEKPMPVGRAQMEEFRKLYSAVEESATLECKLSGNFRPVQPLNDRKVYLSQ